MSRSQAILVAIALSLTACGGGQPAAPDAGLPPDASDSGGDAAPPSINAVLRGAGCGKPLPDNQLPPRVGTPAGYTPFTVMGTGATLKGAIPTKAGPRTFWVRVPADYDPERAYRTVYLLQGCGASQEANTQTYPLYKENLGGTEQAIYVAIDLPTNMVNMNCYDQRAGLSSQEWEAFELFHAVVDANYCVDNNHVYVGGYSSGASVSNMWGCYFAGDGQHPASHPAEPRELAPRYHIRAQFGVVGVEPPEQPPCNGPVAALIVVGLNDAVFSPDGGAASLKRLAQSNGCDTSDSDQTKQAPWHPEFLPYPSGGDVCKRFTDCSSDHPVVLCSIGSARYGLPMFITPAATAFFKELEASPP